MDGIVAGLNESIRRFGEALPSDASGWKSSCESLDPLGSRSEEARARSAIDFEP